MSDRTFIGFDTTEGGTVTIRQDIITAIVTHPERVGFVIMIEGGGVFHVQGTPDVLFEGMAGIGRDVQINSPGADA